jgi:DNA-binding NarL/FixJ family response regulator
MRKIALADDHNEFREGVLSLIKKHLKDYTVCIEAKNGLDLLQQLNRTHHELDIAIIDVRMPVIDGVAVTNIINTLYPKVKTLAISLYAQAPTVLSMLKAGATGYLLKENFNEKVLLKAFTTIEENNPFIDESIEDIHSLLPKVTAKNSLQTDELTGKLTPKEKFFLQLCATSISYDEMAGLMNISIETIDDYPKKLKAKLGISTRYEFAVYALQHGIAKIARLNG